MEGHKKITNVNYRKILDKGEIKIVTDRDIEIALTKIKGKLRNMQRSFLLTLYLSGGRPVEVLELKGKDITRWKQYVKIDLTTKKKGLPRSLLFYFNDPFAREVFNYSRSVIPEMYIFYPLRNKYVRKTINKKGVEGYHIEISDKIRYFFKKWFSHIEGGITPYYLRHNRFSIMAMRGATDRQLRLMKGSRSNESINYYVHLSTANQRELAKLNKRDKVKEEKENEDN